MRRKVRVRIQRLAMALMAACAFSAFAQDADLIANALEVTQGIQDLNNSVRLVANKRTFVRFHVQSASGTYVTTATLTAKRGDRTVALAPINNGGVIQVVPAPDRGVRDRAFLFELPDGFRDGTVSLTAEVNALTDARTVRDPVESDYTNNAISYTATFEAVPPLNLVIYNIGYTDANGVRRIADPFHQRQLLDWILRAWPVSQVNFLLRSEDVTRSLGAGLPDCSGVNSLLAFRRNTDLQNPASKIPVNTRYYGMVDDGGGFMRGCADGLPGYTSSGPTGVPSPDGGYAWDTDGSYGDWYGAHEVAHNFMRYHAEFCGAVQGDAYPYRDGQISPSIGGPDAVFGFDHRTGSVYRPNWKDVMTYCEYIWTGKFTYHGLMDALQQNLAPASGAQAAKEKARRADSQQRLVVVGSINNSQQPAQAIMSPYYVLNNAVEAQTRIPGSYTILLKRGDTVLASYPFTPTRMSSGPGQVPSPELSYQAISELVPYVDGTTRVDITGPSQELLSTVTAGPTAPIVQVVSPNGGETIDADQITVTWTAGDPDPGDQLFFTVQYSADGGASWETVDENLRGVNSTTIDRVDVQGSQQAMFRVLATDGIHTSVAQSAGTFVIAGRPPQAQILSPLPGTPYIKGESVSLEAFAYDSDTGAVAGNHVKWSSNLDGPLGTGAELTVSNLSVGSHAITLTVDDDSGSPVTATVNILVAADASGLPVIADKVLGGPEVLFLDPAQGAASAILLISNANLRNPIAWTASVDKPWLLLDATAGTTPQQVQVSVGDISSLPAGTTQIATITLTSTVTGDQKTNVRVELKVPTP